MKQATILAGLAAGLATAAHHGHGHAHNNARRGDDGVVTSWSLTTEWTYVTVTAGAPGGGAGAPGNQGQGPASSPTPAAAPAPSSSDDVQAAAVTGGASDPNAAQASKNAAQASINAAQKASDLAHQSSMQYLQGHPGQTGGSQPAQSAPAATSSPVAAPAPTYPTTTSSAAAPSKSSGGGSPPSSGGGYSAIGTYYGAQGGYGSCGQQLTDDGHYVALADDIMQATNKKLCGATITINCNGQSYKATVQDSCPGCDGSGTGHIDITQGFAHVIDPDIDTAGHATLTWSFDDQSMASMMNGAV